MALTMRSALTTSWHVLLWHIRATPQISSKANTGAVERGSPSWLIVRILLVVASYRSVAHAFASAASTSLVDCQVSVGFLAGTAVGIHMRARRLQRQGQHGRTNLKHCISRATKHSARTVRGLLHRWSATAPQNCQLCGLAAAGCRHALFVRHQHRKCNSKCFRLKVDSRCCRSRGLDRHPQYASYQAPATRRAIHVQTKRCQHKSIHAIYLPRRHCRRGPQLAPPHAAHPRSARATLRAAKRAP